MATNRVIYRTAEELQEQFEQWLGMKGELSIPRTYEVRITFRSPTGVEMFHISLGNYGSAEQPAWGFGGTSGALPESWAVMNRIGRG